MATLSNFSSVIALSISPSLSLSVSAPFSLKHSVLPCTLAKPIILDRGISAASPDRRPTIVFASRFYGAEGFIDEADVDECAFAALVLRSGYTKTSKGSRHDNYWCDLESIEQKLKVAEKDACLNRSYINHAAKAFPFFPEELPSELITEPPAYALDVNIKLFSKYLTCILPEITSNVGVLPSSLGTYKFDILLLQCLSTAIFAGIDMAEIAFEANPNELLDAVFTNDHGYMFELMSSTIREKCLKQRLKFLEKKLVKFVRRVEVERLPKHYVLSDFYIRFVLREQKLLGIAHLVNKFKI